VLFRGKYRIESARLKGFDYSSAGSYFVTINTKRRLCWFGDVVDREMRLTEIGDIIADEWQKTPTIRPRVTLDVWQIMPNHVHGIVIIHENEFVAQSGKIPFVDWDTAMVVEPDRRPATPTAGGKPVGTDSCPSLRDGGRPPTIAVWKSSMQNQYGPQRENLGSIVRGFKSACTTQIRAAGYPRFQWQSRFWDRIIRDQHELDRIRKYIIDNPKNWKPDQK
jgi:putative transposase